MLKDAWKCVLARLRRKSVDVRELISQEENTNTQLSFSQHGAPDCIWDTFLIACFI